MAGEKMRGINIMIPTTKKSILSVSDCQPRVFRISLITIINMGISAKEDIQLYCGEISKSPFLHIKPSPISNEIVRPVRMALNMIANFGCLVIMAASSLYQTVMQMDVMMM